MDSLHLQQLWNDFRDGADSRHLESQCDSPTRWLYAAALCYSRKDDASAARCAAAAAKAAPGEDLYAQAARYLVRNDDHGRDAVYTDPEAFEAFIRGGGNVGLYEALSRRLREHYTRCAPATVLDIGVGDGLALMPVLSEAVSRVDLLEPSRPLLNSTTAAVAATGTDFGAWAVGLEELGGPAAPWPARDWDIAQSTFAIHNVPRRDRQAALRRLRDHTRQLLIAEFDVPAGYDLSPECFLHVTSRYVHGLAEYAHDGGLVAQGFLMPVMFGYFDPDVTHDDQPIARWTQELTEAGFTVAPAEMLYDYWFAPAYLLHASAVD